MINSLDICEKLCWCLTIDAKKNSFAHSWRNVVFRNAEIRSHVPTVNIHEAHQFALERITLLGPVAHLHEYWTSIVSSPCDSCVFKQRHKKAVSILISMIQKQCGVDLRGCGLPLATQKSEAFWPSFTVISLDDSESRMSGGTELEKRVHCSTGSLLCLGSHASNRGDSLIRTVDVYAANLLF